MEMVYRRIGYTIKYEYTIIIATQSSTRQILQALTSLLLKISLILLYFKDHIIYLATITIQFPIHQVIIQDILLHQSAKIYIKFQR